jgi:hypothetical protein
MALNGASQVDGGISPIKLIGFWAGYNISNKNKNKREAHAD